MARGLTPTRVATLKHSGKRTGPEKHHDRDGLILRVQPSGAKAWIWRGTVAARRGPDGKRGRGKRVEIGLGSPSYVTLDEARDTARDYIRLAKRGNDPRGATLTVPTFAQAMEKAIALRRPAWRGKGSENDWRNSLKSHVVPALGTMPVDAITARHVTDCLQARGFWTKKPVTARRVLTRIRAVLEWARGKGYVKSNVAKAAKGTLPAHNGNGQKHMAALPWADVPGAVRAIRANESGAGSWIGGRLALELQILTAARSSEVCKLTWNEIDLKARVWRLPADKSKTGAAHDVPLAPRALEILSKARQLWGRTGYVFRAARGGTLNANRIGTTLTGAGIPTKKATPHGFRSSFRDWGADNGHAREVLERALNHVVTGVEGAYYRTTHLEQRRPIMDAWADYIG